MTKYIARPVLTSNYTPERKPHTFARRHSISLDVTQKNKNTDRTIAYTDKYTCLLEDAALSQSLKLNSSQNTKIDLSTIYTLSSDVVCTEKHTIAKVLVKDSLLEYVPGDSILLWASNSKAIACILMDIMGLSIDTCISFTRTHIRTGSTVFSFSGLAVDYFQHFIDVTSVSSKLCLHMISEYACAAEKDRLLYLASKEGSSDYFAMAKNWNSFVDVLIQFGVHPPLSVLLEFCTEIKPRAFSLINTLGRPSEFLVRLVSNTFNGVSRNGHFSEYVANSLIPPESVDSNAAAVRCTNARLLDSSIVYRIQLKPNKLLRLRSDTTQAMLFGVGTGVAPFISFVRNCKNSCRFTLFYGCTNRHMNVLLHIGLIEGPGAVSVYIGAILFQMGSADVHVVYSRENKSLRMHDFLAKNKHKLDATIFSKAPCDIYICGNKEASAAISKNFADTHPNTRRYIDDWS